ncbi:MAG: hypothetical protein R8P61_35735 [Bacteroidia bacterium]|nr:hypothetical protein [Bacteroidia bacterium]
MKNYKHLSLWIASTILLLCTSCSSTYYPEGKNRDHSYDCECQWRSYIRSYASQTANIVVAGPSKMESGVMSRTIYLIDDYTFEEKGLKIQLKTAPHYYRTFVEEGKKLDHRNFNLAAYKTELINTMYIDIEKEVGRDRTYIFYDEIDSIDRIEKVEKNGLKVFKIVGLTVVGTLASLIAILALSDF